MFNLWQYLYTIIYISSGQCGWIAIADLIKNISGLGCKDMWTGQLGGTYQIVEIADMGLEKNCRWQSWRGLRIEQLHGKTMDGGVDQCIAQATTHLRKWRRCCNLKSIAISVHRYTYKCKCRHKYIYEYRHKYKYKYIYRNTDTPFEGKNWST